MYYVQSLRLRPVGSWSELGGGDTDVEASQKAERVCTLHICANRKKVYAKIVFFID